MNDSERQCQVPVTAVEALGAVSVGLDDGYALTKLALPDGRLVAVPSRARIGGANITWLNGSHQRVFEYTTEHTRFAVGELDGEPTQFDDYPVSGLNRAIVQHALQEAGLAGRSVHAVSGLPVGTYYGRDGQPRTEMLDGKRRSLKQPVEPLDGRLPATVAFHEVIPEALAAWYDHVITETDDGVQLESERVSAPIAVVDIGGRTTDFVVVADQAVRHESSGSLHAGILDLKRQVADGVCAQFDLESFSERALGEALRTGRVSVYGRTIDVSALVDGARRELLARLHAATERQLGRGAELERVLFVGGWRGRARRVPAPLVPERCDRRTPALCERARHAQVPALRLRRVASLRTGFTRGHCGSVATRGIVPGCAIDARHCNRKEAAPTALRARARVRGHSTDAYVQAF